MSPRMRTKNGRMHQRRGRCWQCLIILELRLIFSLKAVSILNWKNVARPPVCNWDIALIWLSFENVKLFRFKLKIFFLSKLSLTEAVCNEWTYFLVHFDHMEPLCGGSSMLWDRQLIFFSVWISLPSCANVPMCLLLCTTVYSVSENLNCYM